MMKWKNITINITFLFQVLILFLLFAENSVAIPVWLQPGGRMHPLILHFPLVMVFLLLALQLFGKHLEKPTFEKLFDALLVITVPLTAITVLAGFFLSREEGYTGSTLDWHKWTAVAISFILFALIYLKRENILFKILLYSGTALMILTGHFGATLTHGDGFLTAPLTANDKPVFTASTPIFEGAIMPVLEAKCQSCHNPRKSKGDLDMTTWETLLKGGENGAVWEAGLPGESAIIKRALLPDDHDDHMPPEGKPQLTPSEIALLSQWIQSGADHQTTPAMLTEQDTLFQLVSSKLNTDQVAEKAYTFGFASDDLIEELNTPFRTVRQITPHSPALQATIFVRQAYQPEFLTGLLKIKEQLVSLNLAYLPLNDDELKTVGEFTNLEKLVLNHTDITGEGISYLTTCENLEELALSGTAVTPVIFEAIGQMPELKTLACWNTNIKPAELSTYRQQLPGLTILEGYVPNDSVLLKITPPIRLNKSLVLAQNEKVTLGNKISDADIFYTLDGSNPDSSGIKYNGPFDIEKEATVKAVSKKEGWLASDPVLFAFSVKGHMPENIELLVPTDRQFRGNGTKSLIDGKKGEARSFRSPFWLGFRDTPFVALADFGVQPPVIQEIVVGSGVSAWQYILKPEKIEVYGGDDPGDLKLISSIKIPLPDKSPPTEQVGISVPLESQQYRYYKILAHPVAKLPEWHRGKGEKGWVFVDEVFFY